MHKAILTSLLSLIIFSGYSQEITNKNNETGITGRVIDSLLGKPIEYAAITLYGTNLKKAVNGTVTDNTGAFSLTGVEAGVYTVMVESVGYLPYSMSNIRVNNKTVTNIPAVINLAKSHVTLQNVTVTSSNALIENKIDKVVFNAEKDLTSQGGVATDILKKIPQVSVDVDGNVELAGSSSIRFLINGKPSSAFGSSINDLLQSLPASQIKSIEVITNPGARYDAQGLGGIINIILKQSRVKGINGNLSLTAGTRNENGSFNFNARKGNFGVNAFASGNIRLSAAVPYSNERLSTDTLVKTNISLQQAGANHFKRHGTEAGMSFDWTLRKKNNFTGSLRFGWFGNSGYTDIDQLQVVTAQNGGSVLSGIQTANHTDNHYNSPGSDLGLNYKRTFNKEDQELEISLNSSYSRRQGLTGNTQLWQPQDSLFYGTYSGNPGTVRERELQVDYTQPFKNDIKAGIGGKINYIDIASQSDITRYKPDRKAYYYDTALSNYLNYTQNVYALYGEVSFPVAKLFDTKIGGRYERTEINSFYSNAQAQTPKHGYNTFVPSVFFSRKLGDNQTIKLSFSKRIERPDYSALNPFINTTDPKSISAGNPYLKPELGHRYELSYSRNFKASGSFAVTAFYRINDHDIQPFIVFYPSLKVGDSVYTNVAVSTWQNIGTEKNMGVNIYVDLHIDSKLNLRSNFSFFRRHTINVIDAGYNSNSFNYRFNMNASYQFTKNFAGEFFGNFYSARHEAQGRYPSAISYNIALRKQFWNKKGSIALSAANPFSKYVNQRTALFGPNFTVNSLRQVPFRAVSINFTWKFGKLEFRKDKDENKDNTAPPAEGT